MYPEVRESDTIPMERPGAGGEREEAFVCAPAGGDERDERVQKQ